MGKQDQCPCCGFETEDQTHLYHCTHKDMISAKELALDEIAIRLTDANVPKMVTLCFLDSLRRATRSDRPRRNFNCHEAEGAMAAQETLGTFAILRGHHHRRWTDATATTYKRRRTLPGQKKRHDKSPFDMSVLLIEEVWTLFETLWSTRNSILHGTDSFVAKLEDKTWTTKLLDYKKNQNKLLHYGDRYLIDYPRGVIQSWDRKKKKSLLDKLERLHKQYLRECKHASEHQRKLTSFDGFTLGNPEDDTENET